MVKRDAGLILISIGIWAFSLPVLGQPASWLDRSLSNWNRDGKVLPELPEPATQSSPQPESRCREEVRQPTSAAERAVVRRGWKLYGPVQSYETTMVFTALAGFDGMCRPLGYQAFVYSEGRYAGTLSPVPMNSRTDGSLTRVHLGPLDSHHCRVCPLSRFRPTLLPVKDEHSRIPGPKRRSPGSGACKRHDEAGGSDAGANWRQSRQEGGISAFRKAMDPERDARVPRER